MRIDQIVADIAQQVVGRLLRRALLAVGIAALAVVALSYLAGAGMIALEVRYGALYAHLIMAGIFAAGSAVAGIAWWTARRRPLPTQAVAATSPQTMKLAALLEAAMLGYTLARRGER